MREETVLEKLLEQISAYELLNNLLPGALLYALLSRHTGYQFKVDNVVLEIFIFYFIGLVAGRFGSLVIEPVYKKLGIINTADYKDFIAASKKDSKIEALSSKNNMYRTFIAVLVLYAIWRIVDWIVVIYPILRPWFIRIGVVLLILLFSFSYRKQTKYVFDRINTQIKNEGR